MAELIAKRDAALKACREAEALKLYDVAQRHWEEHIRCLHLEMGIPIPASLQPGEEAPKP
jgi:hypothetical protein